MLFSKLNLGTQRFLADFVVVVEFSVAVVVFVAAGFRIRSNDPHTSTFEYWPHNTHIQLRARRV